LQSELVQIPQRSLVERIDEVPLDEEFFHLCCFLLPVRLFEREKAVPNKPSERDRAIVHHSAGVWSGVSGLLGYFTFQYLSCFRRFHLRLQPENYRDDITFLLIRSRIEYRLAKVPVPFLSTGNDPTPLIRLTHSFLSFCGGTSGPAPILRALPADLGEALSLVDELFNFACPIT
jgi:hypothetical protein